MSKRHHSGGYAIPDDPTWLEFPRSDGDPAELPKNTTKIVDSEGQVNFMRPVTLDESLAIMWRINVGAQLAVRMQLPEGPKYVLRSFPEGYHLYDHNKGPEKSPRHDPYLCGSINVNRFRSVNEFIPHALWLMQDPTMLRANCSCKYCTKQPQRIVTDTMGLGGSARRSASAAVHHPSTREPRARRDPREPRQPRPVPTKPYAAVRRTPKLLRLPVGPEEYISPERDLDIRMSLSYADGRRPRWFRKGELLWCHLELPIRGRIPEEDIIFWPGLVEDVHIKTQAVPMVSPPITDMNMDHLYAEAADGNPALGVAPGDSLIGEQSATAPVEAQGIVPWTVRQWYVYKMKLLGVAVSYFVSDEQVLPYLAYAPSDGVLRCVQEELANHFQTVSIDRMDQDLENHMFDFDPTSPEPEGEEGYLAKYKSAAAPYTFAIQIASNVAQFWLPTDEWDCKFTIPPASPAPAQPLQPLSQSAPVPTPQPSNDTLHSLIQQSMSMNAASPTAAVATPNGPVGEAESISMIGSLPRSTTGLVSITQTRFQGLWWGTERIWTDELVRLKIARCQFAPKGTDIIYPPAGPSASTLAELKNNSHTANVEPLALGASEKGLFLRLEGLFVVEVPTADGTGVTKECRASGMVYELVDYDWEEEVPANDEEKALVKGAGKGKGKAREVPDDEPMSVSRPTSPAFMNQPSPLKPPPLPNPDPSVPIGETASAILTQTSPAAAASSEKEAKERDLTAQMSHPVLSTPYPLPPASKGFRFRPILPPGHEVVISLSLISGRYYPGLLYHPLMASTVQDAFNKANGDGGFYESRHLWAMDGLLPGVHQSMDPRFWRASRLIMLQEADKQARERFKERWEETKLERLVPPMGVENGDDMDVDVV